MTPTRFENCPIPGESCWSRVLWKTSRAGRTREISLSHQKVRTWLNQPYTKNYNRRSGYNLVFLDLSRFCWDTLGFSVQGMWQKAQQGRPGCQIPEIPIGFSIFEICQRRFDPWSAPPRSPQESKEAPCLLRNGSEPSPIHDGASMDWTSSGMLHRYLSDWDLRNLEVSSKLWAFCQVPQSSHHTVIREYLFLFCNGV